MKNLIMNRALAAPRIFCNKAINPKKIGVVLKDGSINFLNQEAAIEYGINQCRKSLLPAKQLESAVGIKDSKVVFEIMGNESSVRPPDLGGIDVLVHSHPDTYAKGCTTAISSGDYETFIENENLIKLLAVNSKGEYYEISKMPGVDYSKFGADKTFGDFSICMDRTLYGHSGVPAEQKALLEECIKTKDVDKYYLEFYPLYVKPTLDLKSLTKTLVDKSHEFWVKFGEHFGVTMKTNFSNFVNK